MPARRPATGWEDTDGPGPIRKTAVVAVGGRGCGRDISEVLNFGEILGAGTPAEISGQPHELASRLSDVEDSYLGRTGPGGPGQ
jgi:hypothetical protein